jgi:para-aminobenzoate synthetase/4-amino-4-deoxychorismate lyase
LSHRARGGSFARLKPSEWNADSADNAVVADNWDGSRNAKRQTRNAKRETLMSFALLDDCTASAIEPRSRLYTGFVREIRCLEAEGIVGAWKELESELVAGRQAVVLCDYEFGEGLVGIAGKRLSRDGLRFLVYRECRQCSVDDVKAWLVDQISSGTVAGVVDLEPNVDRKAFNQSMQAIRDYIAKGTTYQVNYTYRLHFKVFGDPICLYLRLRERQPVQYGALIRLPDDRYILSLSPELFVQCKSGRLMTRPMKGTARRTGDAETDAMASAALANDSKNKAENLMIVDLLRNDLGRVAVTGSVRVPELFAVEPVGDVLQMSSVVAADCDDKNSFPEILSALFPCGSITGAPKRRTMELIRELEPAPRGIYTGAIGWIGTPTSAFAKATADRSPSTPGTRGTGNSETRMWRKAETGCKDEAVGSMSDFCLSVAIRTLALEAKGADGLRRGEMGVGAGILYESDPDTEYEECRLKAQFLTRMDPGFVLIETMAAGREQRCVLLDRHLARLDRSAHWFGFQFDLDAARRSVEVAIDGLDGDQVYKVRMELGHGGAIRIEIAPLQPVRSPVKVLLGTEQTESNDLFLYHKTSVRRQYNLALAEAEKAGAFDMLFTNQRGELTEGARSNVFIRLGGDWYTPPVQSGLLPGVMRSVLLEDRKLRVRERVLTRDDLFQADEVFVCNALHGALSASVGGVSVSASP